MPKDDVLKKVIADRNTPILEPMLTSREVRAASFPRMADLQAEWELDAP
jgi:hypothetical protein